MKTMGIQHSFGYSIRKSAYVEAFNKTIQSLIAREASATGSDISTRWVDSLDRALFKYNFVNVHSFIKMTPAQAELPQSQQQLKILFDAKHAKVRPRKPKLKVGDQVRIWRGKGKTGGKKGKLSKRSYFNDFSDELFTINKVLTNMPIPRFQLKDQSGKIVIGNWFQEELSQYITD